jgi:hypothetical protein
MTNTTDQSAPRFGEAKIADIPAEHFAAIKRLAHDESHDFFVSIIFDDVLFGSGTLIDAWGTLGVLTAYHVAQRSLDRDPDGILALNIDDRPHRFEIPRCCVEHIPLGVPDKNYLEKGLDLSFLKLSGLSIISTLKSKKSFYRIGGKSFDDYAEMDPAKLFWWVIGAPGSTHRAMTSTSDEGALLAKHLIAEAGYGGTIERGDLDILRLVLLAGKNPFPRNYKGVSGGPVWTSALTMEYGAPLTTSEFTPCHLAGIVYYQGDLSEEGDSRELLANGPRSLASLLKQFETQEKINVRH